MAQGERQAKPGRPGHVCRQVRNGKQEKAGWRESQKKKAGKKEKVDWHKEVANQAGRMAKACMQTCKKIAGRYA
jgi:hypothetical protein